MLGQAIMLGIYITRLGGDFMAFRFLLPPLVILGVLVNDIPNYIFRLPAPRKIATAVVVMLTAVFAIWPTPVPQRAGFIADERQYYELWDPAYMALLEEPNEHPWYQFGLKLRKLQYETGYPIALGHGNIGYRGFAAGPKVRIVDVYGLVDREIARNWEAVKQLRRGRPGHEIKLTVELAVIKGVTFWRTPFADWNRIMATPFGTIITIDPEFLRFYPERIPLLKELKEYHLEHSEPTSDIRFFITILEEKYDVRIEDLPEFEQTGSPG
jgi:hypothetical protein